MHACHCKDMMMKIKIFEVVKPRASKHSINVRPITVLVGFNYRF